MRSAQWLAAISETVLPRYQHNHPNRSVLGFRLGAWGVALVLALVAAGCTGVSSTQWTRLDGSRCEADNAKPSFYAGAIVVACAPVNGSLQPVPAEPHDIGMMAGMAAFMGLLGGSI